MNFNKRLTGFLIAFFAIYAFLPQCKAQDKRYSIVGVGDMVMGLNYPDSIKPRFAPNDGRNLFDFVKPFISSADIAVGNLEGVLLDKGGTPKKSKDPKLQHIFRMPTRYVSLLTDAGFDFISIANNHSRDFGDVGQQSTINTLRAHKLHFAGVSNLCESSILYKDGVHYGFCAFAPNATMLSPLDYEYAEKIVRSLAQCCDIVIVSVHAGAEGAKATRVPRAMELYAGERRGNVHRFCHKMVDAGADVIFGHGPHVVRGMELYRGRFIAYSLGNFCTPFGVSKKGKCGYAPAVKINIDKQGAFIDGQILAAVQQWGTGPVSDTKNVVINEIVTLSRLDFPESPLKITASGKLSK